MGDQSAEVGVRKIFDSAKKWNFDITNFGTNPKVREVLIETLQGKGNFVSNVILTADEALDAGIRWVGKGYTEIGTGVFRSADGLRQFRMDKNSIIGAHSPGKPHIHFETYQEGARKFEANNHVVFEG